MEKLTRKRATAIIIKDSKILLIRRVKAGKEYFVIPGGGVEEGETIEEAIVREVKEELSLEVKNYKLLFSIKDIEVPQKGDFRKGNSEEHVFEIIEYVGTPEISGPEKERMGPENQYYLVWIDVSSLQKMENLYPKIVVEKLMQYTK